MITRIERDRPSTIIKHLTQTFQVRTLGLLKTRLLLFNFQYGLYKPTFVSMPENAIGQSLKTSALQISTHEYILTMSFDKFIQTRTIAKYQSVNGPASTFPTYGLSSFIDFETDGYLVGIHFMFSCASSGLEANAVDINFPAGAIVAKVSGDVLSIPAGGNITNYSGAQVLISHLEFPSTNGEFQLNPSSRQTTIAYDADSKRIPIKSNDRLGVYLCDNANNQVQNFAYTLTAYFVRS